MLLLRIADADDAKPSSTNERDVGPYVLVGALAANTAFTIYNLATIGHAKPKLYGFGEALLTAPQALVFSSLAAMIDDDDGDAWIPASIAIWTGVLATHGIYTLARSDESSARSSPRVIMFSFDTRF
jgi:hypothetical protein